MRSPPSIRLPSRAGFPRQPWRSLQARTLSRPEEELVQVNIRVRRGLGDQLADRARAEKTSQKVIICRALAAVGFEVHHEDLRAVPPPRRRGSS